MNGKRPEEVSLLKGDKQSLACPNCGRGIVAEARTTSATCSYCNQAIDWGLRK